MAKRKTADKWIKVREAARITGYTTAGLYAAIKRGDLSSKKIDGLIHMSKREVKEYHRRFLEMMNAPPKDPNRPLTDEEFMREMWESDPDD